VTDLSDDDLTLLRDSLWVARDSHAAYMADRWDPTDASKRYYQRLADLDTKLAEEQHSRLRQRQQWAEQARKEAGL
jgi:hypothetical protein